MGFLLSVAFVVGVLAMYWSMPIGCLCYRIRFLDMKSKRDDMFRWAGLLVDFFGITLHRVGTGDLLRSTDPVLYLANHRCWADFFLDVFVTEGRAAMLSRWAVFPIFPIFLSSALLLKGVLFFKRNVVFEKTKFNAWLDTCLKKATIPGLVVYPEGHRSTLPISLPLRRGMLHYAHSRKMPVQIVITKDKEKVLSEKRFAAGFGAHLLVGYSRVIKSAEYADFADFMAKVQAEWDETWAAVYSATPACPTLRLQQPPCADYPQKMRVQQAVFGILAIVLLLSVVALTVKIVLSTGYAVHIVAGTAALLLACVHKATLSASEQ